MLKAGPLPMQVNDELINLVKEYASKEEAKFINYLKPKQYYEVEDLKSLTGLDDEVFKEQFDNVLKKALLTEIPHKYKPDTNVYILYRNCHTFVYEQVKIFGKSILKDI